MSALAHERGMRAAGSSSSDATNNQNFGFDEMLLELRKTHSSLVPSPLSWRVAQLEALKLGVDELSDEICAAVTADLGRHKTEAFLGEVASVAAEAQFLASMAPT